MAIYFEQSCGLVDGVAWLHNMLQGPYFDLCVCPRALCNVPVLNLALARFSLRVSPYAFHRASASGEAECDSVKAVIIEEDGHWYVLRKIGVFWWNLDPRQPRPSVFAVGETTELFAKLLDSSSSYYLVQGVLPQLYESQVRMPDRIRIYDIFELLEVSLSDILDIRSDKKVTIGTSDMNTVVEVDGDLISKCSHQDACYDTQSVLSSCVDLLHSRGPSTHIDMIKWRQSAKPTQTSCSRYLPRYRSAQRDFSDIGALYDADGFAICTPSSPQIYELCA